MRFEAVMPPAWVGPWQVPPGRGGPGTLVHQRTLVFRMERVVQASIALREDRTQAPSWSGRHRGGWACEGPAVAWAGNDRYVLEGHAVRRLAADGRNTILVGSVDVSGYLDFQVEAMPPGTPCFSNPTGLAHADGFLFLADSGNGALRRFELATGTLTTVAGNPELAALAWELLRGMAPGCPRCGTPGLKARAVPPALP